MASGDDFRLAVAALWQRLGLGPPVFAEQGRVRLIAGKARLDLVDNGRGGLVIEGVAVTLSGDETRRADRFEGCSR